MLIIHRLRMLLYLVMVQRCVSVLSGVPDLLAYLLTCASSSGTADSAGPLVWPTPETLNRPQGPAADVRAGAGRGPWSRCCMCTIWGHGASLGCEGVLAGWVGKLIRASNHLLPAGISGAMNAKRTDDLILRAQEGDVQAFEVLYRQHVGRVHALCRRMAPSEADELTQRAFVRAWEALSSFEGRSAFGSWLHRLAVNVILTEKRSAARRTARVIVIDDPSGSHAPRPVEVGMDLERAIAALPERAREVFVLHDIEGYKHREIADAMSISEGTSKGQLHRARKLLREALSA